MYLKCHHKTIWLQKLYRAWNGKIKLFVHFENLVTTFCKLIFRGILVQFHEWLISTCNIAIDILFFVHILAFECKRANYLLNQTIFYSNTVFIVIVYIKLVSQFYRFRYPYYRFNKRLYRQYYRAQMLHNFWKELLQYC